MFLERNIGRIDTGRHVHLHQVLSDLPTQPALLDTINEAVFSLLNIKFCVSAGNEISVWKGETTYPLESASGAVVHALILFYTLCQPNADILLLDEPGAMFHPPIHTHLRACLVDIVKKQHRSVVAITHAPNLIGFSNDESLLRFVRREATEIVEPLKLTPQASALVNTGPGRNALFAHFVIVVEGPTDALMLSELQRALAENLDYQWLQAVYIVPTLGCGGASAAIDMLRSFCVPYVVLLDADGLDGICRKQKIPSEVVKWLQGVIAGEDQR